MKNISVIGAGSWGSALAIASSRAGNKILLWSRKPEVVCQINDENISPYLPEYKLGKDITATDSLEEIINNDIILLVIPTQSIANLCQQIKNIKSITGKKLIICCKGIEQTTLRLISEIINDTLPNNHILVLSGPNFADEVAKGDPTATTIACDNEQIGKEIIETLASNSFRPYYNNDIIGAQIGGAIKNVIAIACGIVEGVGYGENSKFAVVTRGVKEISKLCVAKGGSTQTLMGLCGFGDMMLTCATDKSRNMQFGKMLGKGATLQELLSQDKTVEGYHTTLSVDNLANKLNVEMPICKAVKQVLYDELSVSNAIDMLLNRPYTSE